MARPGLRGHELNRCSIILKGILFASFAPLQAAAPPGISVWDTVEPSGGSHKPEILERKEGWRRISRDERGAAFQGDAVLTNGRVLLVFPRRRPAVEVYSEGAGPPVFRAELQLLSTGGSPAASLEGITVRENTRSAARLEASYRTMEDRPVTAMFRLKRGGVQLEAEPVAGAEILRVKFYCRFAILPDFFADDILVDPRRVPLRSIELPSEHFLLHLSEEGQVIVMCVYENREQEVRLQLSGMDEERAIAGSEIHFGKGGKIWVALLESPQIWHALEIRPDDAKKVQRLHWNMPFAAQWRIDFTRTNGLTDSWEMLLPEKSGGGYRKPSWLGGWAPRVPPDRKRWTTVLGWFQYPFWIDRKGRGHIQPLKHRELSFEGPAVIYPINRTEETPIDTYTVVDIVRNCLGVGPCEYILKVEGQKQEMKGRATCTARDALVAIYKKNEQKQKRKEVEAALDDALTFVTHIRDRIARYVGFGYKIRAYLAEQKRAHPELGKPISELDEIARELETRFSNRRKKIKTPDHVTEMNEDFRRNLIAYDGPDIMERLKKYTDALTQIGANQDELVGECRWVVRSLRQRAGILMALDPGFSRIAEEVRARAQEVLLNPATYEGARH